MKLEINAEDVERMVRDSILQAGVGKAINEGIQKLLQEDASTYRDGPIRSELRKFLTTTVKKLLETEFKDRLEAATRQAVSAMVTDDMLKTVAEQSVRMMVKSFEERD